MKVKRKSGRLTVDKQFILDRRFAMFKELIKEKWSRVDIGILFNIDPSAILRVLKGRK